MVKKAKKSISGHFFVVKSMDKYILALYLLLAAAFLVRVVHLNYNSAFNDEAIYIVVGRMGLFASDWWSYGAKLWMAGIPYIYPTLAALSFELGGLNGARLLNIIFGIFLIEEVYRFTNLLNLFDEKVNKRAAIIAAFFTAFAGVGIFVSKLATYDMPSFLLMMVGINSFLKARSYPNGKYYFLSFLTIFTAFLTKIVIAVYFPLLFLFSLLILKGRTLDQRKKAIIYLYVPLFAACLLYFIFYKDNLGTYVTTHKELGKSFGYYEILELIWREIKIFIIMIIPASLILIASKRAKVILSLSLFILAIPLFHLYLLRLATLDKHLYLTAIFMAVIVGYAVSVLISNKNRFFAFLGISIIPLMIFFFLNDSYRVARYHENDWKNTYDLQNYLVKNVQPGDKILTEEGGVVVLALYDKIFPPENIVTFDWIDYSGLQTDDGYLLAVDDTYFDFIELSGRAEDKGELREMIRERIKDNYKLSYKKENFEVYEKQE